MTAQVITLPKRDISIILMVYQFGGCSSDHVRRKLFPGLNSPRACNRHIAGLVKDGYLLSQRLPPSSGIGSGKAFLTVSPKGRAIVAQALGLSLAEISRSRIDSPRFIEHHLAICTTRVNFELAVECSNLFTILEWTRDRDVDIKVKDSQGKEVILTPDGAFTLSLNDGRKQQFFIEQDLGTMTNAKRMRQRLAGYLISSKTSPIPVLFVTTTQQRLSAIASLALEEAKLLGITPKTIWLTTNERLTEQTTLNGSIWQVVGVSSPIALSSLVMPDTNDVPATEQAHVSLQEVFNIPEPATPIHFEAQEVHYS